MAKSATYDYEEKKGRERKGNVSYPLTSDHPMGFIEDRGDDDTYYGRLRAKFGETKAEKLAAALRKENSVGTITTESNLARKLKEQFEAKASQENKDYAKRKKAKSTAEQLKALED